MNDMIDDKTLAEYLNRDSEFSRRYRALETDAVPTDLDDLVVREAANQATRTSGNRLRTWRRLTAPLAAAATVVLAISVVIQNQRDHSVPEVKQASALKETVPVAQEQLGATNAPAPTDRPVVIPKATIANEQGTLKTVAQKSKDQKSKEVVSSPAAAKKENRTRVAETISPQQEPSPASLSATTQPRAENVESTPQRFAMQDADRTDAPQGASAARSPARPAAPSSQAIDISEIIVTAQRRTRSTNTAAGPRGTIGRATFEPREPTEAETAKLVRESDPVRWLNYIRDLRAEKKNRDADREWRRFIEAYPRYFVADDDAARPNGKP